MKWTASQNDYQYAEAIQNEIGGGTEGVPDVWDDGTGEVITNGIKDVESDAKGATLGFRIEYHVAPTTVLGEHLELPFILSPHETVAIRIYAMDVPGEENPVLVRAITEGYADGQGYLDPTNSPFGKFQGSAHPEAQGSPFAGTAAYWDGKWDRNYGEEETDGHNVDTVEFGESFRAVLVLDGSELLDAEQYEDFAKDL